MAGAERHRDLFVPHGPQPLSSVGAGGRFARLWDEALHDYEDLIRPDFDSMALDGPRQLAAQSAAGRGKKRVPTPKTAAKAASNAAC